MHASERARSIQVNKEWQNQIHNTQELRNIALAATDRYIGAIPRIERVQGVFGCALLLCVDIVSLLISKKGWIDTYPCGKTKVINPVEYKRYSD